MTIQNPFPGNDLGLSAKPRAKPKGVLTPSEWAQVYDYCTLTLDALGDGPADLDRGFLMNAIMHQRLALQITHRGLERIAKAVAP